MGGKGSSWSQDDQGQRRGGRPGDFRRERWGGPHPGAPHPGSQGSPFGAELPIRQPALGAVQGARERFHALRTCRMQ